MLAISQTSRDFVEDVKEANLCAALIVKGEEQPIVEIPTEIQGLLSKF